MGAHNMLLQQPQAGAHSYSAFTTHSYFSKERMALMASDEVPRLRIILDHSSKNLDADNTVTVWNSADNLHGHLELSGTQDLAIDGIAIYFEG
jgi:hypothetical protein